MKNGKLRTLTGRYHFSLESAFILAKSASSRRAAAVISGAAKREIAVSASASAAMSVDPVIFGDATNRHDRQS